MKSIIGVLVLVAGVWAASYRNPITDAVLDRISDFITRVQERGLDPLYINKETYERALPVPEILRCVGMIEELDFRGLTNIQVIQLDFDASRDVVSFEFRIPEISASVGIAVGECQLFSAPYTGQIAGSLRIGAIVVKGEVSISVGVTDITAVSARISDATLGNIRSAVTITTAKRDLSEYVNTLLNERLPNAINDHRNEFNELLGIYLVRFLNRNNEE